MRGPSGTKSSEKNAGKRFYGIAQHARPAMADDVTVAVVLLLVALGIATYLETRYLRRKMKNRRVRTAKRDDEMQDNAHNAIITTKAIMSSLDRQGIRSAEAEAWLQEAQTANARHNYRVAMDLTSKAKERLLALKAAQASKGDLAKLDRLSVGASSDEMTTKEMLQKEMPPNMIQSKFSIEVAGAAVEQSRVNGRDVSQATELLEAAKTRFDAKDYAAALSIAQQSKRAAGNIDARWASVSFVRGIVGGGRHVLSQVRQARRGIGVRLVRRESSIRRCLLSEVWHARSSMSREVADKP